MYYLYTVVNSDTPNLRLMKFRFIMQVSVATNKQNTINNNNNKFRSNLTIKCKVKPHNRTKDKQDKESRENRKTPKNVPSSVQQWPTLGERDHYVSLSMSSLQRNTKGLQEINLNELSKNKPNFYSFLNLFPWTRDSMISLTQGVSQLFPNSRI